MALQQDIDRWLLDAEALGGDTEAEQITWLRAQRLTYSERIRGGDWEVQSVSGEGGNSGAKRHKSDQDNHDAIVGALRKLGDTDLGARGALLQVQFGNILG